MKLTPKKQLKNRLALAEDCVEIARCVTEANWDALYPMLRDYLGGFPGLNTMFAEWGICFFDVEPDAGSSYEWLQATEDYTARCVAETLKAERTLTTDECKALANAAIKKARYDACTWTGKSLKKSCSGARGKLTSRRKSTR